VLSTTPAPLIKRVYGAPVARRFLNRKLGLHLKHAPDVTAGTLAVASQRRRRELRRTFERCAFKRANAEARLACTEVGETDFESEDVYEEIGATQRKR
jgi:hypothetical protein